VDVQRNFLDVRVEILEKVVGDFDHLVGHLNELEERIFEAQRETHAVEIGELELELEGFGQKGDGPLVQQHGCKRQLDQHPRLQKKFTSSLTLVAKISLFD